MEGLNLAESPDEQAAEWEKLICERLASRQKGLAVRKENGLLSPEEEEREQKLSVMIRACTEDMRLKGDFGCLAGKSREESEKTEIQRQKLASAMEHAAGFIRRIFGKRQELVIFLTGLTEHSVCQEVLKKEEPKLWFEAEKLLSADSREEELRKKLQG